MGTLNIANLISTGTFQSNGGVISVNLNSANTDQAVTVVGSKYLVREIWFSNPSKTLALSAATLGLYTAAAGGGSNLITSVPLTALVVAADLCKAVLSAVAANKIRTEGTLYFRNLVADGGAATVDAYIITDIGA